MKSNWFILFYFLRLGTPLVLDQFAMTKEEALYFIGILMSVGAVIAFGSFLLIKPLCQRFNECTVLIWIGFLLMAVGRFVCLPVGDKPPIVYDPFQNKTSPDEELVGCPSTQEWCLSTNAMTMFQFILGYGLTSFGYPIGVTVIQTLYSKILGPRPQVSSQMCTKAMEY